MKRTKAQILAEIRLLKQDTNNYTESTVRSDPYSLVANKMLEKIPHSKIFEGMTFKEIRAYIKKPVMTHFYNSRKQPEEAFGEDTEELSAFYSALEELFPGAMNVMEAINDRWDSSALHHSWTLPDGHEAYVKVREAIDGTLDNEGLNLPYRFYRNQPSDVSSSLCPNFVHSHDAYILRHIIDNADFTVSHIHDAIGCHPNNMRRVRELYLEALANIATHRGLETFCEQDFGIDTKDFIEGLQDSSYAIC